MDETDLTLRASLTFTAIESRLSKIPEFASGGTRTPRLIQLAATVMSAGIFVALAASILASTRLPLSWLETTAIAGWWTALVGASPLVIYGGYRVVTNLRQWTREQAQRTDHQLEHLLQLVEWLRGHPAARLRTLLDHAKYSHARRTGRIALIAGGVDKLGVLPVLIALFLTLRAGGNPLAISPWAALVGLLLMTLWTICWTATSAKGQLQTYEYLLDMALKTQDSSGANS